MNAYIFILLAVLVGSGVCLIAYLLYRTGMRRIDIEEKKRLEKIIEDAKKEADRLIHEANTQVREMFMQTRRDTDRELQQKRAEIMEMEKRLRQKEDNYDKKNEILEKRGMELIKKEKQIELMESQLKEKFKLYNDLIAEEKNKLEKIAGMSAEEAKKYLIKAMEDEARHEAGKLLKRIEDETRENAQKKAQEIISLAIQRYCGEYVSEHTISVVNLPNEEMKGRIIGREGRNIRAIEAATGVDIIVDDTPEAVIISSFNPLRREIARLSLEKLVADGRIHPGRIEEIVEKTTREVENSIKEAGERAIFDLGLHGVHPDIVKLLGKLKFRTSYSQNVYAHSVEVAFICGIMAQELGLNVKQAKRAALLHDIGKAVDHEVEGTHAVIGAELAKKYGESHRIVEAILEHHNDTPSNLLAVLIQASDALSAARPGVRKETWDTYVKRLEDIERIARSIEGVEKSFAIQAGREIRVIVYPDKVRDDGIGLISRAIAKKIESELTYPGQIKVTVIRELRSVEYAR